MKAFPEFKTMSPTFWAMVKYISEALKYTSHKQDAVRTYSIDEIRQLVMQDHIAIDDDSIITLKFYFDKRADLLNDYVRLNLMDGEAAKGVFNTLYPLYRDNDFQCKLPMNKQKGEKRQIAFFTAIINILTENAIRCSPVYTGGVGFDDNPCRLIRVFNHEGALVGASSRRFDGAYPSTVNPKAVWEIKEYYYNTTFGSRVADGVYETQLDGYELREISNRAGIHVMHIFFLDAYQTWWIDGKSYLCRIIDALNAGLVDEVIVGKEVLTRWPELLTSMIEQDT